MPIKDLITVTSEQLLEYCLHVPFPGNSKWGADHPIWDCYLPGKVSPKMAWRSEELLRKAIYNLFWILDTSIENNKYPSFVGKHVKELNTCVFKDGRVVNSSRRLLELILARFTVAKIAPKVTALSSRTMYKIMESSGLDFSVGVYAPMAGFGGIIEAAKIWFEKHKIPKKDNSYDYLIEAFDINPNFCSRYG